MRLVIVAAIILTLCGCAATSALNALDAVNPMKDDKGIDAAVQLGKENRNSETRGLVNASTEDTYTTRNNISAQSVYQSTDNKDSPWLIIGFALMTGLAFMQVRGFLKAKEKLNKRKEITNELKRRSEIIDFEIV